MNTIKKYMDVLNMNVQTLSRLSNIPYATTYELVHDVSKIEHCQSKTVFAIAEALNVSVDDLLRPLLTPRQDFENFKSETCQAVKRESDLTFLRNTILSNVIEDLYRREWYPESFYLLAMVDYLCRENGLPQVEDYAYIRSQKLDEPLYPRDAILTATLTNDGSYLTRCYEESIPEFRHFNIIESDVRSVA